MNAAERDLARAAWVAAHNAVEEALARGASTEEVADLRRAEEKAWEALQALTPEEWRAGFEQRIRQCSCERDPATCGAHPWMRDVLAAAALARQALAMEEEQARATALLADTERSMASVMQRLEARTRSAEARAWLDWVLLAALVALVVTGEGPSAGVAAGVVAAIRVAVSVFARRGA